MAVFIADDLGDFHGFAGFIAQTRQMDDDILPDGPVFSADFQKPSVQSKVTHTDDGNALKLAWVQSDKIGIWTEAEGKSLQSNSAYLADQEGAGTTFSYQSRGQR